jgi:hypothetical protein
MEKEDKNGHVTRKITGKKYEKNLQYTWDILGKRLVRTDRVKI